MPVGASVGNCVGAGVGTAVGDGVGASVGNRVGDAVSKHEAWPVDGWNLPSGQAMHGVDADPLSALNVFSAHAPQ